MDLRVESGWRPNAYIPQQDLIHSKKAARKPPQSPAPCFADAGPNERHSRGSGDCARRDLNGRRPRAPVIASAS